MKSVVQILEAADGGCCGVEACVQGEDSFLEVLKLRKSLECFRVVLGARKFKSQSYICLVKRQKINILDICRHRLTISSNSSLKAFRYHLAFSIYEDITSKWSCGKLLQFLN